MTPQLLAPWIHVVLLGSGALALAGCLVLDGPRWFRRVLPLTDYGRAWALNLVVWSIGLACGWLILVIGALELHRLAGS